MDRSLSVEYRPLDGLIPYARNARTHSDEQVAQIAASIREFGFTNPVLVDEKGTLIAGHGRVLGRQHFPRLARPRARARGCRKSKAVAGRQGGAVVDRSADPVCPECSHS